jgi:hypothetical protein
MTSPTDPVDAADRFTLREAVARWNRSLDRGDLSALRGMTVAGATFSFDGKPVAHGGLDAFVEQHVGSGEVARRTHVNHLQAWPAGEGVRVRAFSMIVGLVTNLASGPSGGLFPAWVGYTDDDWVDDGGVWKLAARRVQSWRGDVLSRFPGHGEGDR